MYKKMFILKVFFTVYFFLIIQITFINYNFIRLEKNFHCSKQKEVDISRRKP